MSAEPSTLTIHDNPARIFRVSNESDIIAEIEIEYQGGGWWRATLDDGSPGVRQTYASRALHDVQRWAAAITQEQADAVRAECAEICGTDGEDTTGNGTFACGVMNPHGISIAVSDGEGNDLTQDYLINGV